MLSQFGVGRLASLASPRRRRRRRRRPDGPDTCILSPFDLLPFTSLRYLPLDLQCGTVVSRVILSKTFASKTHHYRLCRCDNCLLILPLVSSDFRASAESRNLSSDTIILTPVTEKWGHGMGTLDCRMFTVLSYEFKLRAPVRGIT
jgi:hypothetical protein